MPPKSNSDHYWTYCMIAYNHMIYMDLYLFQLLIIAIDLATMIAYCFCGGLCYNIDNHTRHASLRCAPRRVIFLWLKRLLINKP